MLGVIIIIRYNSIVIFVCFLLIASSFGTFKAEINKEDDTLYYGIIIPLPSGQDTTNETFENSRVRVMINDLLRLNITVFWSKENFTALSKRYDSNQSLTLTYNKGTFIIPFSGEKFKDALIISIITDYNQTHELENQTSIMSEAYLLEEEININCSKLIEPKIAQHFEKPVRYGYPTYLKMAEDGGFLNYEFLFEGETENILNNEDFNVLIWPYIPSLGKFYEQFITFMDIKTINTIRRFVNNGGGFIGTCYGAYVASLGVITPRIFSSLRLVYNPEINRILPVFSLSISDSIMKINLEANINFFISTNKVVDINHPVFYGVNETFPDFFKGPIFKWIGKNTHPLAVYYEIKPYNVNGTVSNKLKNILIGRISWVNSTFGKGKIVLYASHPDYVNNIDPLFRGRTWDGDKYYGRRIIHNSIFFVTSDDKLEINYMGYNFSFIDNIIENTKNLSINESRDSEFIDLYNRLGELSNNIYSFRNITIELKDLFLSYDNSSNNLEENIRQLKYMIWHSEIYIDYINKSKSSIDLLKRVLPMLYGFNDSIGNFIKILKDELNNRLNISKEIINQSTDSALNIKENLNGSITNIKNIQLLKQGRLVLQTLEKVLKYIPKIYFELLKLLRYSWYNYEGYFALEPINEIYK